MSTSFNSFVNASKIRLVLLLISLFIHSSSQAQWFAEPLINPFGLDTMVGIATPSFGDLDNDGDFDMFSGKYYFENVGTAEEADFAAPIFQPFGLNSINTYGVWVEAMGDLDNDGDLDIINNGGFYENTGSANAPEFEEPVSYLNGLNGFCVEQTDNLSLYDIDNDTDLDFIIGTCNQEFITWTESMVLFTKNIGDSDSLVIDTTFFAWLSLSNLSQVSIGDPSMADLDNDGDLDLLLGGGGLSLELYYYQNIGTAENLELDTAIINPFGLEFPYSFSSPAFVDLDNDGDQDLMIGLSNGNFLYYQHDVSLNILEENKDYDFSIYPNPVNDIITISIQKDIEQIELIDLQGRTIIIQKSNSKEISVNDLSPGIYILKLKLVDGIYLSNKIVKE